MLWGKGEERAFDEYNRPRRWTTRNSGKHQAERTAVRAVLIVCLEESKGSFFCQLRCPKVSKGRAKSPLVRPQAHTPCPGVGLTRRLRRGSGLAVLWFSRQLWCPKVSKGRAESPLVRPQAHTPCPRVGIDAPTTARKQGLQPYGAFTLFFRWRKKSVQKKASGTATPGKRLLLPILPAGLVMSRAA